VITHFHQLKCHYGQNPLRQLGQSNVAADKKLTHYLWIIFDQLKILTT